MPSKDSYPEFTVGEIRQWLKEYPDHAPAVFTVGGDPIEFYRVKNRDSRGLGLAHFEFNHWEPPK